MASDYIIEPIETDPNEILGDAVEYIQSRYPNWAPSEAQLDYMIMRMVSLREAQIADMSTRVLRAIFRYFGSSIVNIQPLNGSYAEVDSTWFATDDTADRIIPQDTQVGIRDSATDDLIFFNVADQDWVVPAGTNFLSGVRLRAQDEGVVGNEQSGPLEIVEQLDWVQSANTNGFSAGGQDPESDDDFIGRLTDNFGLLSPRPVLAEDYEMVSRNVAGIWRASVRDNFIPGQNEIQRLSHTGTGGTLALTFGAESTAAIAWNASLNEISDALLALDAFQQGDFILSGGPFPNNVFIEYTGNLRTVDQPMLTIDPAGLTGGSGHTEVTTQVATADQVDVEDSVTVAGVDVSGNTLSSGKRAELLEYLRSLRPQNFNTNIADPTYTAVDVSYTPVPLVGYDLNDVAARSAQALSDNLAATAWGTQQWPGSPRAWDRKDTVRQQDLYTILNNVVGMDHVDGLVFGLNGGTQDTADKVIPGIFPLTRPGVINTAI